MKRVTERAFVRAQAYAYVCEHCGQPKALFTGIHPKPGNREWCDRMGSVECPPLEAATAWYGGLPDPTILQERFERAGGRGRVIP